MKKNPDAIHTNWEFAIINSPKSLEAINLYVMYTF